MQTNDFSFSKFLWSEPQNSDYDYYYGNGYSNYGDNYMYGYYDNSYNGYYYKEDYTQVAWSNIPNGYYGQLETQSYYNEENCENKVNYFFHL